MKTLGFLKKLFQNEEQEEDDKQVRLTVEKQDMIRGVVELSDRTVKEVMVPRIDTKFIGADFSLREMMYKISQCFNSRFTVYNGIIYNFIGML